MSKILKQQRWKYERTLAYFEYFASCNLSYDVNIDLLRFQLCFTTNPLLGCIYLLKVNNRNTRTRCEICSKLLIKTLVFVVVLVSILLTLNIFHILCVSTVNFEYAIAGWVLTLFSQQFLSEPTKN